MIPVRDGTYVSIVTTSPANIEFYSFNFFLEKILNPLSLIVTNSISSGDPDKCDQFGNTALHLSSAKGHLRCVDFLVKFGVNIYALDIDKHSAKDLAAINNRDEILRYLDAATANFETNERFVT